MNRSLVNAAFSGTLSSNVAQLPRLPIRVHVSDPERKWVRPVQDRLEALVEKLQPGWDGYQGMPVSLLNAWFALRMLEATCGETAPIPQIVPGSRGDLQIEWHTAKGDIELHVRAPNDVHAWRMTTEDAPDGQELHLTNDFVKVAEWVAELAEATIAPRTAAA